MGDRVGQKCYLLLQLLLLLLLQLLLLLLLLLLLTKHSREAKHAPIDKYRT